ncbi:hypothetical protein, partial [Streptomyces antnestii]|uniref:hypothetical protein n=1 Tax=Streptomyces antnestii TaxID=2494256 RepID=UPI001CB94014
VEFSRNGRFLCTHPNLFGLSSGQFPFGLAFPTLSDLSDPISSVPFRFSLRPFGFRFSLSGGPNTIRHFPLF